MQARAEIFVIRAQNAATLSADSLYLDGEVRQAFWKDALTYFTTLYTANPTADTKDIVDILQPLARSYRNRRDGFRTRLLTLLTLVSDSLELDPSSRQRFATDAFRALGPLYARSLETTTEEMRVTLQPTIGKYRHVGEEKPKSVRPIKGSSARPGSRP